jgi:hypothetical protein
MEGMYKTEHEARLKAEKDLAKLRSELDDLGLS